MSSQKTAWRPLDGIGRKPGLLDFLRRPTYVTQRPSLSSPNKKRPAERGAFNTWILVGLVTVDLHVCLGDRQVVQRDSTDVSTTNQGLTNVHVSYELRNTDFQSFAAC